MRYITTKAKKVYQHITADNQKQPVKFIRQSICLPTISTVFLPYNTLDKTTQRVH